MELESAFAIYNKKHKSKKPKRQHERDSDSKKKKLKSVSKDIKTPAEAPMSIPAKSMKKKKTKANLITSSITNGDDDLEEVVNNPMSESKKKTPGITNGNGHLEEHEEIPELIERSDADFFDGDTTKNGASVLKWLLYPVTPGNFFETYWEVGPLHINRNNRNYYKNILTTSDIDVMLREHPLFFGRNVDIVTYKDGQRVTDNPSGRAKASIVLNAYSEGYSVRILNPQTYNHKIHLILATLQEYFGTMVGVNVYLTPAGSQGFAPHYDDIEAFVIQLEGRKHWKLYKPKEDSDNLARFSSKDFKREDLGELMAEVTLQAGNILYFPRGVIHEAKTDDDMHSLHLTISTYQRTAFVDLLEKALPAALNKAALEDIEFRKGLPLNYLQHLGIANTDVNTPARKDMIRKTKELILKLCNYVSLDDAADQLGRKFVHDALPPVLNLDEQQRTSRLDGERLLNGKLVNRAEIDPDTKIRLIRYYAIRLALEENEYRVYFCTENAKVYHAEEEQFMTIDNDLCPIIEVLLSTYPLYTTVENLPHEDISKKIALITDLWDYGIVVTRDSLEINDNEDIDTSEDESD